MVINDHCLKGSERGGKTRVKNKASQDVTIPKRFKIS